MDGEIGVSERASGGGGEAKQDGGRDLPSLHRATAAEEDQERRAGEKAVNSFSAC